MGLVDVERVMKFEDEFGIDLRDSMTTEASSP